MIGRIGMISLTGTDRTLQRQLQCELDDVECRFAAELMSDLPCVNGLIEHVERYRGKMLRPMLVLVTGMATSREAGRVTDGHRVVAAVMEMVHMATLVHDDILDDATVRRRGQTVNALSGNETAVMLGDYLISHAYHLCSSLDAPDSPTDRAHCEHAIGRIVADATNTVCEGELLQLANRNNWDLDEATYFEIIRRKTASLCGACCRVAALLHGSDGPVIDAAYDYGEKVGVAFQIVDDILDLVGAEQTVGKTLGRDLQKGKLTLPLIHCLKTVDADHRATMRRWLENGLVRDNGVEPVSAIRKQVIDCGSLEHARQWARRLIDQAQTALDAFPQSPARALLNEMAEAVLARDA